MAPLVLAVLVATSTPTTKLDPECPKGDETCQFWRSMAYEQHDDALTWEFRARKALKGRRDAEKLLDVCTEQPPVPEPQPLVDVSVEPWVGVLAIVGAIGAGVVLGVAL